MTVTMQQTKPLVLVLLMLRTCISHGDRVNPFMQKLQNDKRQLTPKSITGLPTVVSIGIFILEMHAISEQNMDYTISIYFRRTWTDSRLRFKARENETETLVVWQDLYDQFWIPDIFFVNERAGFLHTLSLPNTMGWIDQNGTVFMSSKLTLTLACPMHLQKFPLDVQHCKLEMECFSFNTDHVVMKWWEKEPVELPKYLHLPQYWLESYKLEDCTNKYALSTFPCLRLIFVLRRNYLYFVMSTYVPCAMIVIISWVSFWISPAAAAARTSLGVTTVLTMITQNYLTSNALPKVPYVKAIDVWNAASMFFVFSSLLEFALVNVLLTFKSSDRKDRVQLMADKNDVSDSKKISSKTRHPADKMDCTSRLLFPILYVVFVCGYFIFYTCRNPILEYNYSA